MVNITKQIIEDLKNNTFSIPIKDIRNFYATKKPTYPMIAIAEINNSPRVMVLGDEKISNIGYRFEIYTRDGIINGKAMTKDEIADIIAIELDEFLRKTYGLKRNMAPSGIPYGVDDTILRTLMIYNGKIDNKTLIMYQ